MRGKEEEKGKGKEEKKRRGHLGIKWQERKSVCILFLCAVVIFWINQKYVKHTISSFVFIQDCFDAKIM